MAAAAVGEQLVVAGRRCSVGGVEPVGEQGEAQVALAVGQVVDLQAADLGLDVRLVGEEHRHDDERPQLASARRRRARAAGSGLRAERSW